MYRVLGVIALYALYRFIVRMFQRFINLIMAIAKKAESIMNKSVTLKDSVVSAKNANNMALILADYLTVNPNATMENSALLRAGSEIMRNVKNMPVPMQIERLRNVESVISEVYTSAGLDRTKKAKIPAIAALLRETYNETNQIPAWIDFVLAGDFDTYLTASKTVKIDGKRKPTNTESTIAPLGSHIVGNKDSAIVLDSGLNPIVPKQAYKVGTIELVGGKESTFKPNCVIFTVKAQDNVTAFKLDSTFTINNMSQYVFTVVKRNTDAGKVYATYALKGSTAAAQQAAPYGKPTTTAAAAQQAANSSTSDSQRIDKLESVLNAILAKLS